jgi:hypothetical protein
MPYGIEMIAFTSLCARLARRLALRFRRWARARSRGGVGPVLRAARAELFGSRSAKLVRRDGAWSEA